MTENEEQPSEIELDEGFFDEALIEELDEALSEALKNADSQNKRVRALFAEITAEDSEDQPPAGESVTDQADSIEPPEVESEDARSD